MIPHAAASLSLWMLASAVAPQAAMQAVADAERAVESARRTDDSPDKALERVRVLGAEWLEAEAEAAESLPLDERLARRSVLITEARRRELRDVEASLSKSQSTDLDRWFAPAKTLLSEGKALRAVALRRGALRSLPADSSLRNHSDWIEKQARAQVLAKEKAAAGPGERALWSHALALLDEAPVATDAAFERLLRPQGTPEVSADGCPNAPPSFQDGAGVSATQTFTLGGCPVALHASSESRVGRYIETVMEPFQEDYTEYEDRQVTSNEAVKVCRNETVEVNGSWQTVESYSSTQTKQRYVANYGTREVCSTDYKPVTRMERVAIEKTRTVMKPVDYRRTESFVASLRDYLAAVDARVVIAGDAQRVELKDRFETARHEEHFDTVHVGSSRFSDDGEARTRAQFRSDLSILYAQAVLQWNGKRGEALLAAGTDAERLALGVRLIRDVSPEAQARLEGLTAFTPVESKGFATGRPDFDMRSLPTVPPLQLPPPSADVEAALAAYERRVDFAQVAQNKFGALQLGLVMQEPLTGGGASQLGFGLGVTFGYQPMFSTKSVFHLRGAFDLQMGYFGFFQFDVAPRLELGLKLGPLTLAAVGMAMFAAAPDADELAENLAFRQPTYVGAGYGGRLQLIVASVGIEVLAARVHRTLAGSPIGLRGEARVFYLSGFTKLMASVRVLGNGDTNEVLSAPGRFTFFSVGVQSDF